jgi:hypothetical protein
VLLERALHRSSNSRTRICVNIQQPFFEGRSQTPRLLSLREGELRGRRRVGTVEDLLDREAPQLLGEHLDPPGAVVAELPAHGHVLGDRELALAGKPAAVDHLVEPVFRIFVRAV